MKQLKFYFITLIISIVVFQNSSAQTFHTEFDTVNASVYLCPSSTLYDTISLVMPDTVNIRWHVVASNFPGDWYLPAGLGILDNAFAYSNLGYALWNGTTGVTHLASYSPSTYHTFGMVMDMSSTTTPGTFWMEIQLTDTLTLYTKNIWFVITRIGTSLVPDSGLIIGPPSVCLLSNITLSETVSGGTWSATNGNAIVSAGIVTGISTGVDTIKYTVTSSCSISSVATKIILVNPPANPGSIVGSSTVCVGSNLSFADTVSGGTWSVTNGNATAASSLITGVNSGTDTVIYVVTNSCGNTANATKTITINPLPTPAIAITGSVLSTTTTYTSYQWLLGSSSISGATDAAYSAPSSGSYAVTVTDGNGCNATSAPVNFTGLIVPEMGAFTNSINIYPNPVCTELNILSKDKIQTVLVLNLVGQTVFYSKYDTEKVTIDLSNLKTGMYFVNINGQVLKMFVKY